VTPSSVVEFVSNSIAGVVDPFSVFSEFDKLHNCCSSLKQTHTRDISDSDTEEWFGRWRQSCFACGALLSCSERDQGLWA